MKTGTFRRYVVKTLAPKITKTALRTATKNTHRVQIAQATVALKGHTGQLLQVMSQYLLGLQQTQEIKQAGTIVLGDIGYDLTVLARVLKVKIPASTKKSKLVGTRAAGILMLDSLATDLLRQIEQGLFVSPVMTTVKKIVTLPKTGTKEERNVEVVNTEAETAAEAERQQAMKSFLAGAIDVYWRLCYDMTGNPPATVLADKFKRMQSEYPGTAWVTDDPQAVAKPAPSQKAPKGKKKVAVLA